MEIIYRFPKCDIKLKKWLWNVKILNFQPIQELPRTAAICGLHFKDDDFKTTVKGRKLLNQNAVPTLFPNSRGQNFCDKYFENFETVSENFETEYGPPETKKMKIIKNVQLTVQERLEAPKVNRSSYPGDIQEGNFIENEVRNAISVLKNHIVKKNKKIKTLTNKNFRLQQKLNSLKETIDTAYLKKLISSKAKIHLNVSSIPSYHLIVSYCPKLIIKFFGI